MCVCVYPFYLHSFKLRKASSIYWQSTHSPLQILCEHVQYVHSTFKYSFSIFVSTETYKINVVVPIGIFRCCCCFFLFVQTFVRSKCETVLQKNPTVKLHTLLHNCSQFINFSTFSLFVHFFWPHKNGVDFFVLYSFRDSFFSISPIIVNTFVVIHTSHS